MLALRSLPVSRRRAMMTRRCCAACVTSAISNKTEVSEDCYVSTLWPLYISNRIVCLALVWCDYGRGYYRCCLGRQSLRGASWASQHKHLGYAVMGPDS